ncbi:MAG: hypothetical protein C4576_15070 [Desulfobacteraceae bacterium]|nr:MAG: hypothetical protein C4576_15070 [Desulfobacteraceae bacterium]
MIYQRPPVTRPGGEEILLQTKAAYWEQRIKTYGFEKTTDLSLLEVSLHPSALPVMGLALVRLGEDGVGFHLAFSRGSTSRFELSLVVSLQWENAVLGRLSSLIPMDMLAPRVTPVDVVFFHGPHFGDRYGIFHAAAKALRSRNIRMLAFTCSGSCIYLVLPKGKSEEAVPALAEAFDVPLRRSPPSQHRVKE